MVGTMAMAQVRETTYYDDGSYYTGERNAKGVRHGNGIMVCNISSLSGRVSPLPPASPIIRKST